eukprot:IDg21189t1
MILYEKPRMADTEKRALLYRRAPHKLSKADNGNPREYRPPMAQLAVVIRVVAAALWQPRCGSRVVAAALRQPRCGSRVVAAASWQPRRGGRAMAPGQQLPRTHTHTRPPSAAM